MSVKILRMYQQFVGIRIERGNYVPTQMSQHAVVWSLKEGMKDDSTNAERNGDLVRNNLK